VNFGIELFASAPPRPVDGHLLFLNHPPPHAFATGISFLNKVSGAPGFWIGNVIVMAGVPSIMQAMFDEVAPKLKIGVPMLSETVRADAREGDIGMQLGEIACANPEVAISSQPFFDPKRGPNTNVVLRARDVEKLALAKREVEEMLERRQARSNS
jgi:molybdopterin-biosynthesis enzyme MoeA-like protein